MGIAMMNDLAVLTSASALARHSARRHALIAENLANADTPGFRARDLHDFATIVKESFTARATRPGHVTGGGVEANARNAVFEPDLPASPDGNTVVIEDQMLRAVETQGQYRLALTVYGKTLELLRLGLGRLR